jgi:hypothetical protein
LSSPRNRHFPDHFCATFLDAIDAIYYWGEGPMPTVNCQRCQISLAEACRLVWHCTDLLPGIHRMQLAEIGETCGIELSERQTYATAARIPLATLNRMKYTQNNRSSRSCGPYQSQTSRMT